MSKVTIPGACHAPALENYIRRVTIADLIRDALEALFAGAGHGSPAFPLRDGYHTPLTDERRD